MLIFWKKYPHGENLNRTYREKVASSVGCASASLSSLKPLLRYSENSVTERWPELEEADTYREKQTAPSNRSN